MTLAPSQYLHLNENASRFRTIKSFPTVIPYRISVPLSIGVYEIFFYRVTFLDPMEDPTEIRPWGSFKVLHDSRQFKVKILEVLPGKKLSYQRHKKRSERWTVVSGEATVIIDGIEKVHLEGDVILIDIGSKHRLINNTDRPVIVVEVQMGEYFGEDDIERFEDDYGRI